MSHRDSDLIARIYPAEFNGRVGRLAKRAIRSSQLYCTSVTEPDNTDHDTVSDDSDEDEQPDDHQVSFAEIRFSSVPATSKGFFLGTSEQHSDICIPSTKVSSLQCRLTFDAQNRLIIHDWASKDGTAVTYGKLNSRPEKRKNFQWILSGNIPQDHPPTIWVHRSIGFRVEAVHHEKDQCPRYLENVSRFRKREDDGSILSTIELSDPRTEAQTDIQTPNEGPLYLHLVLGEGGFGRAVRWGNVSDGSNMVVKEPKAEDWQDSQPEWESEARNMQGLDHPHTVKLLDFQCNPRPRLVLEYASKGSLYEQQEVTQYETWSILEQALSALEYSHTRSLIHRDIKPANILVKHRDTSGVHILLADFGLSKLAVGSYHTQVGTAGYVAPELCTPTPTYCAKADIWSLGVVVYELLATRLRERRPKRHFSKKSIEHILDAASVDYQRDPTPLKRFILDNMLVKRPANRQSASACLRKLSQLRRESLVPASGNTTPTQASFDRAACQNVPTATPHIPATTQSFVRKRATSDDEDGGTVKPPSRTIKRRRHTVDEGGNEELTVKPVPRTAKRRRRTVDDCRDKATRPKPPPSIAEPSDPPIPPDTPSSAAGEVAEGGGGGGGGGDATIPPLDDRPEYQRFAEHSWSRPLNSLLMGSDFVVGGSDEGFSSGFEREMREVERAQQGAPGGEEEEVVVVEHERNAASSAGSPPIRPPPRPGSTSSGEAALGQQGRRGQAGRVMVRVDSSARGRSVLSGDISTAAWAARLRLLR